jgi:hypothetical protein
MQLGSLPSEEPGTEAEGDPTEEPMEDEEVMPQEDVSEVDTLNT